MTDTTSDIAAIRDALAAGPTPGPWESLENRSLWGAETRPIHDGKTCLECGHSPSACGPAILGVSCEELNDDGEDWTPKPEDMGYIAACHPERIARLLDALEAAQKDAARYGWLRSRVSGHRQGDSARPATFAFPGTMALTPVGDIMRGSVAQHLDAAIDAAMKDAP